MKITTSSFAVLSSLVFLGFVSGVFSQNSDPMYKVTTRTEPSVIYASVPCNVTFSLLDIVHYKPIAWGDLQVISARRMHIVVVGQDLDLFGHVHVEDFGQLTQDMTEFTVELTFPKAGTYGVVIEFSPASNVNMTNMPGMNGTTVQKLTTLNVQGAPRMGSLTQDYSTTKAFQAFTMDYGNQRFTRVVSIYSSQQSAASFSPGYDYRVAAEFNNGRPIPVGQCVPLLFNFTDLNGIPLMDLMPYLEHPMHLAVAHETLSFLEHFHGYALMPQDGKPSVDCSEGMPMGDVKGPFGPQLFASYSFPKAGKYMVFVQTTQQDHKMLLPAFMVNIQTSESTRLQYCRFLFMVANILLLWQIKMF